MSALNESVIPGFWIAYFRERFRGEINEVIANSFSASGLTKADLARKLGRRPEQITRWLSAPCNLEADTISDLCLALGLVPRMSLYKIDSDKSDRGANKFFFKAEADAESQDTGSTTFMLCGSLYNSAAVPTLASNSNRDSKTTIVSSATVSSIVPGLSANA